jgi:hydroxyacylglutathione hydrolase
MEILQIFTNSPLRNFTYLLIDSSSLSAVCIDPYDSEDLKNELNTRSLQLKAIVNTHEHRDHTHGNQGLLSISQEGVWAHPLAIPIVPGGSHSLLDKDRIQLGDTTIEFLHTPGHTDSSLTILGRKSSNIDFLITGDTLFNAGVGNCKNGGNSSILYETISDIYSKFPDSAILYPGHDYWKDNLNFTMSVLGNFSLIEDLLNEYELLLKKRIFLRSNLALERKISSFFQLNHPNLRKKLNDPMQLKTAKEIFIDLRKMRDNFHF